MTKYNQTGTISEVRYVAVDGGKKCEVRVFVDGRDTNWLPKASVIGGAYKIHIPPRVGDQVMVHNENGKNEDGYVTDNIAFDKVAHHEEIDDDTLVMHAEDGTILKHDFKEKSIILYTPCTLDATIEDAVTLQCNSTLDATIAEDVTIKAPKVILDAEVEITKNLSVAGTISDVEGSLTTHTHLGKVGPVPLVRAK